MAVLSLRTLDVGPIGSYDKLLHLGAYAFFSMLAYPIFDNARKYSYLCLGIIVYSGLLEVGQSFVPDRYMSFYDLVANILGVILGALIASSVYRLTSTAAREV